MTVEQRLSKLERSLKLWRLVAVLPIVAVVLMATDTPDVPDVLQVRSLEIVDDDGISKVILDTYEKRGRVMLYDERDAVGFAVAATASMGGVVQVFMPDEEVGILAVGKGTDSDRGSIGVRNEADEWVWSTEGE